MAHLAPQVPYFTLMLMLMLTLLLRPKRRGNMDIIRAMYNIYMEFQSLSSTYPRRRL